MAILTGKVAGIYINDVSTVMSVQASSFIGISTREVTVDSVTKRRFDNNPLVSWTVTVDATPNTDFVVESDRIVFNTALAGSEVVLITGKYWTIQEVGGFYNYSCEYKTDIVDQTVFGESWKSQLATLGGWSATCDRYYLDDTFTDVCIGQTPLYFIFYDDYSENSSYEGYGYINNYKISNATGEIVKETLSVTGDGRITYIKKV